MVAGGVLAYLVLTPHDLSVRRCQPAASRRHGQADSRHERRRLAQLDYILYIGAGAVAAGGIISMLQALPMIFSSLRAGLRDIGPMRRQISELPLERHAPSKICR